MRRRGHGIVCVEQLASTGTHNSFSQSSRCMLLMSSHTHSLMTLVVLFCFLAFAIIIIDCIRLVAYILVDDEPVRDRSH